MTIDNAVGAIGQTSRTGLILDALRRGILSGELAAGRQLIEAELARGFGTSKTPVREALKVLAGAGLVTMSDYRGATVRVVDEKMARDVFDVRALLEPAAVERSVIAGIDLDEAARQLRLASETADETERSLANRAFHRVLYAACGNPLLIDLLDGLRDQAALITVTVWHRRPSWTDEADEHRAILEAAESGDAMSAAALVLAHIRTFEEMALREMGAVR